MLLYKMEIENSYEISPIYANVFLMGRRNLPRVINWSVDEYTASLMQINVMSSCP